jgi:deaminated glutathione amidase
VSPKMRSWRVAAVQMTSTQDRERNLAVAEYLGRLAVDAGASLVAFPEHFSFFPADGSFPPHAEQLEGPLMRWLRNLATELGCYLLAGSFLEKIPRSRKTYNTSVLVGPTGEILAAYRKLYLFDVRGRGRGGSQESRRTAAGERPVTVDTPLGKLGLSVCYDLRFPELYRHMALDGARVLFVPSAFTERTGRHHWMPLLRARAIENQCWVVAPAQIGRHNARRASHGHSAVIDPWGDVVALLEKGEGVLSAEIDMEKLVKVRASLPCLDHVRPELLGREPGRREKPDRKGRRRNDGDVLS